ncbi:MAG: hypothetical protein K8T10_09210 [Candidatus Eremiobacteraeota bacterium]|nr:hypothetical protein [Candidatus Eremiobacteraeota bacterium]
MRNLFNSLAEAFKPIFDREIIIIFLKFLLITIMPLSFMLFIASRISSDFARGAVALVGFIWFYVMALLSLGVISRIIFIKYFLKKSIEVKNCINFSKNFAPTYIIIPSVIVLISYILWLLCHFILYASLVPFLGDILLGLIFSPLVIISTLVALAFSAAIYFAPAIIAAEEVGIARLFRRLFNIIKTLPMYFFVCFLSGLIVTSVILFAAIVLLSIGVGILVPVATYVIKSHIIELFRVVGGTYIPGLGLYRGDLNWTLHIFAFLFYLGSSLLISLVLVAPGIYMCSSSLYIYRLICFYEENLKNEGMKQGGPKTEIQECKN